MSQAYSAGKVVNLAEVSGVQQVMVEVRIAEVSHSLLRRMGVNWSYFSSSGKIGMSMLVD
jgi:pilus assembly protein CpaC